MTLDGHRDFKTWSEIAGLTSITVEADDLDIVELCQVGLAGPLQLTGQGLDAVAGKSTFVIRDVEATPLLLGTHEQPEVSPQSWVVSTQVLRPVDPLARPTASADLAILVKGTPSDSDLARIETLTHGDMRVVWVVLAAQDGDGRRLVDQVGRIAETVPLGDHHIARLAWPKSDGRFLKRPRLPEAAAVAERFGAKHHVTVGRSSSQDGPRLDRGGTVVFFTGLSGSGKSTVAKALRDTIELSSDRPVTLLDGDDVRRMLSAGLGFDEAGRATNVRRVSWVAALLAGSGGLAITALIAPSSTIRQEARRMAIDANADFVEVWVSTPLATCERRDRKGLYALARAGKIPDFTGIDSPYEAPSQADLVIDTSVDSIESCVALVVAELEQRAVRRGIESLTRRPTHPRDQGSNYEI